MFLWLILDRISLKKSISSEFIFISGISSSDFLLEVMIPEFKSQQRSHQSVLE